jgi:hypothetical protein
MHQEPRIWKPLGKGIWMKNNCTNVICGYFDADWVERFDKNSTTSICTFIG